jgi:peptide alpha-N-acetyltransferase
MGFVAFRPLNAADSAHIHNVLHSRVDLDIVGVNWTTEAVVNELGSAKSIGFFKGDLQSFILFKDMGSVLEILLIYSRKGAQGSAAAVLKALVDANGQADEVWLEVHEDNVPAIRFYQQQGFVKVSTRQLYYRDGKSAHNYTLRLTK